MQFCILLPYTFFCHFLERPLMSQFEVIGRTGVWKGPASSGGAFCFILEYFSHLLFKRVAGGRKWWPRFTKMLMWVWGDGDGGRERRSHCSLTAIWKTILLLCDPPQLSFLEITHTTAPYPTAAFTVLLLVPLALHQGLHFVLTCLWCSWRRMLHLSAWPP